MHIIKHYVSILQEVMKSSKYAAPLAALIIAGLSVWYADTAADDELKSATVINVPEEQVMADAPEPAEIEAIKGYRKAAAKKEPLDPFSREHPSRADRTSVKAPAADAGEADRHSLQLTLLGTIIDESNQAAIVNINGRQETLFTGETKNDIRLVKADKKSAVLDTPSGQLVLEMENQNTDLT